MIELSEKSLVFLELGKKSDEVETEKSLVDILLGDKPDQIADILLSAIRDGARGRTGAYVEYASALRIAHFAISNEFSDWDSALHTYTFSHAVQQSLRLSAFILTLAWSV